MFLLEEHFRKELFPFFPAQGSRMNGKHGKLQRSRFQNTTFSKKTFPPQTYRMNTIKAERGRNKIQIYK